MILIPCFNEEEGVGQVIDRIPVDELIRLGYRTEVIVIDNCSTDRTAEAALSRGAAVLRENRKGKGYAIMHAFANIPEDADIIAMIDGDNSYDIREIPRLIEPLENDFGEVIVGTRLQGKLAANSMTPFNRFGNWLFTFLARVGYKTNVTDVCSGFFAWKKNVVDDLVGNLESDGFSIEMEMITKMARMGYDCYSVPVSYNARNGKSNLRPIKDGKAILHAWVKNLGWRPKTLVDKKFEVVNKERQAEKNYSYERGS